MSNDLIQPYSGPSTVDLAAIAPVLVDLAPGATRGLRREQPGLDAVVAELSASVPAVGGKAAIAPDVYDDFKYTHELIQKIRAARRLVVKLAEVLEESEAYYEDKREADISLIVAAVRTAARRKNDSVKASFEKTLAYNGQIAMKGVKTRQKRANGASEEEPSASGDADDASGAPKAEPGAAESAGAGTP